MADGPKMAEVIYDTLHDFLFSNPGDREGSFDPDTSILQLVKGGDPIILDEYKNIRSPLNPDGDLNQAQAFAAKVDAVPLSGTNYVAGQQNVSTLYHDCVTLANTEEDASEDALTRYQKARDFLWTVTEYEDFDGSKLEDKKESPVYKQYLDLKDAYTDACRAYGVEMNKYRPLSDAKNRSDWEIQEPTFKGAIDRAATELSANDAKRVESALAAMEHTINTPANNILRNMEAAMGKGFSDSSGGKTKNWYLSYTNPGKWYEANSANWSSIDIDFSKKTETSSVQAQSYGVSGGYNAGLWSVSADGSYESRTEDEHEDSTEIKINFTLAPVQIIRPWLDFGLFSMKGWNMGAAYPKNDISTGDGKTGTMPLISTTFLITNHLHMTGNFTESDHHHFDEVMDASASVGWGPWSVTSHVHKEKHDDSLKTTKDEGGITVDGLQIIGWVSQVVPPCPPESAS